MHTLNIKLWRDVRRQWAQFAAVTVVIMLGVGFFAASYDAYANLQKSYDQVWDELAFADLFVTIGDTTAFADAARSDPAVAAVETRTVADVPFQLPDGTKLAGRVVGVRDGAQPDVGRLEVLAGAYPSGSGVAAEQHMADHFRLTPGHTITVLGAQGPTDLTVTGDVASVEYLWPARSRQEIITLPDDFGVLFAPEPLAQSIAGSGPNQVLVRLADGVDRTTALGSLTAKAQSLGAVDVLTRAEQPSNAALQEDLSGFQEMAVAFPLLFLGAAALATYVLMTRRVTSERAIIGAMRAGGVARRAVLSHYLTFGAAAGLVGSIPGVILGVWSARALTRFYVSIIDVPHAVIAIRPTTIVAGLLFGVVVGGLAALPAALTASRVPPAEAMRGVVPAMGDGPGVLERLIPAARRLPARWQLPLRGIGRNRRRTAFTIVGVMLALLLILTSWTLVDTMDALLGRQFGNVETQDATVVLASGSADATLTDLAAVRGIAAVEPAFQAPVTLRSATASYSTTLSGLRPDTTMHGFLAVGGGRVTLDGGIVLGVAARDLLGVDVGEQLTVTVGGGPSTTATVTGFVDEPLGTRAYASLDWLATQAPVTPNTALIRFAPGVDRDTMRSSISALAGVAAYEDSQALQAMFRQYAGLFYGFVGAMLVLGAVTAFAIIFTTMSVNIAERAREVATLRASGVRMRTLARLISVENLMVTVLGIVPGLILGVIGGRLMLDSFSSDMFRLDMVVRPLTLALSAAAILAVAVLSQWPGLRSVRRLDIATVVREQVS